MPLIVFKIFNYLGDVALDEIVVGVRYHPSILEFNNSSYSYCYALSHSASVARAQLCLVGVRQSKLSAFPALVRYSCDWCLTEGADIFVSTVDCCIVSAFCVEGVAAG